VVVEIMDSSDAEEREEGEESEEVEGSEEGEGSSSSEGSQLQPAQKKRKKPSRRIRDKWFVQWPYGFRHTVGRQEVLCCNPCSWAVAAAGETAPYVIQSSGFRLWNLKRHGKLESHTAAVAKFALDAWGPVTLRALWAGAAQDACDLSMN
jgi:hypothetical protein